MGVLAANGIGNALFWDTLVNAQSGIAPITLFDTAGFPIQIAGEVKDFDFARFVTGPFKAKRLGRHTQLALAAFQQALQNAQVDHSLLQHQAPVPIFVGVSTSAMEVIEHGKEQLADRGPTKVSPHYLSACQPQAVASVLAASLGGVEVQVQTFSTACTAGLNAVAAAALAIRTGRAEIAIAGGADAPITPLAVASFGSSGMVPEWNGSPSKASRPFDRDRRGGILAEGAGFVVLETLEHARARGATIYLEIRGFGNSMDRSSAEPGTGLSVSMSLALANAGHAPTDVDVVCAHGPSDPVLDRVETAAIKEVLGKHAYSIPVFSIKGVTGNPLAAAGPLQVAACALSMQNREIPPTANHEAGDEHCDLDYVAGKARSFEAGLMLINVHGLGGVNSSLAVGRVESA
jgi:3-oxoacyl-[acyl-carrier-protein] synthase II